MSFPTLHIGLGTFREVVVEDITKHKVDSEQLIIPQSCVDRVNRAKQEERRICAIGTTVMRAMEASVSTTDTLKPFEGGLTSSFTQVRLQSSRQLTYKLPHATVDTSYASSSICWTGAYHGSIQRSD